MDLYFFGIVYFTLFENKLIAEDRYDELNSKIQSGIEEIKKQVLHVKNPSALKHLKLRITNSIEICKEFVL